ncbi:MAG: DUF4491 family protein [Bacteroidaceae bacterium]|nr:DUF4491 family protein [Bacteroidaceae bacterium]
MHFQGIIVGAATFLIIGLCHPLVIKGEYYLGRKLNVLLAIGGIASAVSSVFIDNQVIATIMGALAFSLFWGIKEVYEQELRVKKGLFPMNPKRKDHYDRL